MNKEGETVYFCDAAVFKSSIKPLVLATIIGTHPASYLGLFFSWDKTPF